MVVVFEWQTSVESYSKKFKLVFTPICPNSILCKKNNKTMWIQDSHAVCHGCQTFYIENLNHIRSTEASVLDLTCIVVSLWCSCTMCSQNTKHSKERSLWKCIGIVSLCGGQGLGNTLGDSGPSAASSMSWEVTEKEVGGWLGEVKSRLLKTLHCYIQGLI